MMETKKVKHALNVIFVALLIALLIVLSSFSTIIQSHCECHAHASIYHKDVLIQNSNTSVNSSYQLL